MRPKDLPYPYKWEERRPLLKEGVFYVPEYYFDHKRDAFPCLKDYFGNENPIHIEYCSGNGEWIINKALQHPEINWIAVEMWFERVRKIHSKRVNREIKNLLIVSGEGLTFSREYLPESVLDAVYVNFPDPWPKDRHAKHRIIQKPFVKELKRTLKPAGHVTLVTDHTDYKEQMVAEMSGWKTREETFERYGGSFFKRLWLSHGKDIHYLAYANG